MNLKDIFTFKDYYIYSDFRKIGLQSIHEIDIKFSQLCLLIKDYEFERIYQIKSGN